MEFQNFEIAYNFYGEKKYLEQFMKSLIVIKKRGISRSERFMYRITSFYDILRGLDYDFKDIFDKYMLNISNFNSTSINFSTSIQCVNEEYFAPIIIHTDIKPLIFSDIWEKILSELLISDHIHMSWVVNYSSDPFLYMYYDPHNVDQIYKERDYKLEFKLVGYSDTDIYVPDDIKYKISDIATKISILRKKYKDDWEGVIFCSNTYDIECDCFISERNLHIFLSEVLDINGETISEQIANASEFRFPNYPSFINIYKVYKIT